MRRRPRATKLCAAAHGQQRAGTAEPPRPAVEVAPSEELTQRVRDAVAGREDVTEGTTFGCVTWMVNGNVACGVTGDRLLVRVDRCDCERLLAEPHVQPMRRGTRTMRGFVTIDSDAIADDVELTRWVDAGTGYAAWLSPKPARSSSGAAAREADELATVTTHVRLP